MNAEKWLEIKNAFHEAAALGTIERAAFWDSVADAEIRREAQKLLVADAEAETFAPLFSAEGKIETPQFIGNYQIERELGRGGMGVVYLAARVDLKKKVALKIIRRGMDSEEIVRRFLTEREILAALEHANIARLLDGGTTDEGLPYFVMEYVEGDDLLTFCEKNQLSSDERIVLFRKICQAISYAHSRLVVHRDLKPSNILVMPDGEPKLLDFGISKLLSADAHSDTGTATKLGMMTPKYASPEQFRGETVSTAADIYSLGVILYELLTGCAPFDFENRRLDEIARIVFEDEPPRPSSAAAVTDRNRSLAASKNHQQLMTGEISDSKIRTQKLKFLRGDLDNIILKALKKEVARRYLSVENLSEDLRRYLQGLPVTAHADTFAYRAAKFVRRNRVPVLAAAIIALVLLGGAAATFWQARVARAERTKAEQRFEQVRALANNVIFKYHDEIETLPGSTKVRQMIVADALGYLDELARDAGDNRLLQTEIARAYLKIAEIQNSRTASNLNDADGATESLEKSLAIQKSLAADHPDLDLLLLMSQAYVHRGDLNIIKSGNTESGLNDYLAAQTALRQAVALETAAGNVRVFDSLAQIETKLGVWQQENSQVALEHLRRALDAAERAGSVEPQNAAFQKRISDIRILIGCLLGHPAYTDLQNYEAAIAEIRQGLQIKQRLLKADPNNTTLQHGYATSATSLAEVLLEKGAVDESLEVYEEAFAVRQDLLARDADDAMAQNAFAIAVGGVGKALVAKGEADAGIAKLREAVRLFESFDNERMKQAANQHTYALSLEQFADALQTRKNFVEAERQYRAALDIQNELLKQSPINLELASYVGALKIKTASLQLKSNGASPEKQIAARAMLREGVRQLDELSQKSALRRRFAPAYDLGKQELARL